MHIEQAAANAAKSVPVSGGRSRGLARRGLAPLELVLSLPIMLLIMALMVNFGTLACWKVRGLSMARLAVWGSRWPRSGDSTPRPAYWPAPGTVGTAGPVNVPQLDDARVDQPVARGPQFMQAQVNTELLDPTRGLRTGSAGLTRQYPMLGKLPQFQLTANTYMLDDRWQYPQMNMGSNTDHRIPILYTLPEAPDKYLNAYVQAYMNIINAPFQPQLQPLDNDPDFLAFQGSAPDFYPRLALFCSADRAAAQQPMQNLINRIQGSKKPQVASVAQVMAQAFIGLYQQMIRVSKNPAQIALLQKWISELQQFLASLKSG